MSDSNDITGGDAGGQGHQPVSWEPPIGSPAMSPLETLGDGTSTDILPAVEPRAPRSKRPWLIGTAVAAVLVLVLGGAAAALLLNRPDVKLQRALSATTDRPTGSMTMSVRASDVGDELAQSLVDNGSVRLAWDHPGDQQQITVLMHGDKVVDVVSTPDSVVITQGLASLPLPGIEDTLAAMREAGRALGPDGEALVDFTRGVPLRIKTGPDSAFGKLLKQAESTSGSKNQLDEAKIQSVVDKIQQSVRDHVTVTDEGSDESGDQLRATVPLKPVIADVAPTVAEIVGQPVPADLLSGVKGDPTLVVDTWVKDGVIAKVEIDLGPLMQDSVGGGAAPDITLVIEMSDVGVQMPPAPISDLPDSIFDSLGSGLLGGMGGLGGLGAGGGNDFGVESSSDFDVTESS